MPPLFHWKQCAHCTSLGPYVCDSVVIASRPVKVRDLIVGDYIHRRNRPERKAQVVGLSFDQFPHNNNLVIARLKVLSGEIRFKAFKWYKGAVCWALRPGPCNSLVCELHVRELGDRTHVCEAHWDCWDYGVSIALPDGRAQIDPLTERLSR